MSAGTAFSCMLRISREHRPSRFATLLRAATAGPPPRAERGKKAWHKRPLGHHARRPSATGRGLAWAGPAVDAAAVGGDEQVAGSGAPLDGADGVLAIRLEVVLVLPVVEVGVGRVGRDDAR